MKRDVLTAWVVAAAFTLSLGAQQKKSPPATLRSILLQELHDTHDRNNAFACVNNAVANLTPEQASWTDGKGNHSVGQLLYHMTFWNQYSLAKIKRRPLPEFNGDNNQTFDNFAAKNWKEIIRQFDQVMTDLEDLVTNATDAQLAEWAPEVSIVASHNAYHIGEIVMVRKEQGVWDASRGVK